MRPFCLNCNELIQGDMCNMCFTRNQVLLMCENTFKKLSFVLIDYVPRDFALRGQRSPAFVEKAKRASLLVLLKWEKSWLGGIACTRIENQPGLLVSYYTDYTIPLELRLFLFNLTIDTCIRAQEEELFSPEKLTSQYIDYCRTNVDSELFPNFQKNGKLFRLLLRDVPPKLCSRVARNLEQQFSSELTAPDVKKFVDKLDSSSGTPT
jgi:hypothetical protein